MWIQEWGPVDERLVLLGTRKSCSYLLKGDRYALLGGAGQWVVPELESQFDKLQLDLDRIEFLLISHSHYDHCGAVPYLTKRLPNVRVVASDAARKMFDLEKAVRNMQVFSREACEQAGVPMEFGGVSLEFERIQLERTMRDGDTLELGDGVRVCTFETPGHSRCSLTTYEPTLGWLFPGDSLHPPSDDGQHLLFTASESFTVYQDSLRKLQNLDVNLCAWEHHGLKVGEDANDVVRAGMQFTRDYHAQVLQTLADEGDAEAAALRVSEDWIAKARFPFLPERVMQHIARGIVEHAVAERL
ncbi:MAG: MBL fold metallo-hydrolase [Deltaproteobacteria bacterium]|nr:MBL fold metallo-hydrolase [Deltaproteobacteria bacterium]